MSKNNTEFEQHNRTFTSFSGADIVAVINGRVIGELQGITYSSTREKAGIWTLGDANYRSVGRGKRGTTGEMVFAQFDRDALIDEMYKEYEGAPGVRNIQQYRANMSGRGIRSGEYGVQDQILNGLKSISSNGRDQFGVATWDDQMTKMGYASSSGQFELDNLVDEYRPEYADQILPFNITISGANEYGARASMSLYGVELLNEVSGFSVDDIVSAKVYTFMARNVTPFKALDSSLQTGRASSGFGDLIKGFD